MRLSVHLPVGSAAGAFALGLALGAGHAQVARAKCSGRGRDRWRTVRLEKIDGRPATEHPLRAAFEAAGFVATAVGLEHAR